MTRTRARTRTAAPLAALALLLAGCSDDAPPPSQAAPAPSPAVTPSASPAATATPSAAPAATAEPGPGAKQGLVLGGIELGVTRVGVPFDEAVAAVAEVLGAPDADPQGSCIGQRQAARWGEFQLAGDDGALTGWLSRSTTLQTPSGVTVGTSVVDMQRLYGDDLERFPSNPDNPPTFSVRDTGLFGSLTDESDDATVTALYTRACSGP